MSIPSESSIAPLAAAPAARCADRRRSTWHALWAGSFARRRRGVRRFRDQSFTSIDWHHPQWLAVTTLILLLCCADAALTLTLIDAGALELNPFMRPLVMGSGRDFALWKLGLTSAGVVTLVLLARTRAFGLMPVGQILYLVLFGYTGLVGYELWLLNLP
jgi:hypothetical protein